MRSLCIMPVYNQVQQLPNLLKNCRYLSCDDLLIVDDGSTDGSSELIANSGFRFIHCKNRIGVGHALIQGSRYAIQQGYDVIVHLAGNGKMRPSEMERLLTPIRLDKADYVWGSRYLPGGEFVNAPTFRKYGIKYMFNLIPFLLYGKKLSDATCGYRAYRTEILEQCARGWDNPWLFQYEFEYYVLIRVLQSSYRYLEVPISMVYPADKKNYSKIVPFISWWSMIRPWLLLRLRLEPKPLPRQELKPLSVSIK